MKRMKRFLVIMLAVLFTLSTIGCSGEGGGSAKGSGKDLVGIWEVNYDIGSEVAKLVKEDYGLKLSKDINKVFVLTARVEFEKDDDCNMYIMDESLGSNYEDMKEEFLELAVEAMYDAAEKNKEDMSADEYIEMIEEEEDCSIESYLEYCIEDVIDMDNLSDYAYLEGTYETKKNKLYVEDEDDLLEDIEYVNFSVDGDVLTIEFPDSDFIDELLPGVKTIVFNRISEKKASKDKKNSSKGSKKESSAEPEDPNEPEDPSEEPIASLPSEEPSSEEPIPVTTNEIVGLWSWRIDVGTFLSNALSADPDLGDVFAGFYSPFEMEVLIDFREDNSLHMSVNWSDEDFERWSNEFVDYSAEAIYIYIEQNGLTRDQADQYFKSCYGYTVSEYVRNFLPDALKESIDPSITNMDQDAGYYRTEGGQLYFGNTMDELYSDGCDRVSYNISGNIMTWTELPLDGETLENFAMLEEFGGIEFPMTLERR